MLIWLNTFWSISEIPIVGYNSVHNCLKHFKNLVLRCRKYEIFNSEDWSSTHVPLELMTAFKNSMKSFLLIFPAGLSDPSRMQIVELADSTRPCYGLGGPLLHGDIESCVPSLLEINKSEIIFSFRHFPSYWNLTYPF